MHRKSRKPHRGPEKSPFPMTNQTGVHLQMTRIEEKKVEQRQKWEESGE